jgi:flagellar hook assembly protein FlgD
VPRIASALLVAGLLVATVAAFAVTERLKLVRSPIQETRLDRGLFSPVCGCETDGVQIGFRLRRADRITLTIVDSEGRRVRTLIRELRLPAGPVTARWDGRDESGAVVPEGAYKPRVHLARQRRTIELPNPMRVDTTAPEVARLAVKPRAFSPDGDGRRDKVAVQYALSEKSNVSLLVNGEQRVTVRGRRVAGKLEWHGREQGRGAPPGRYELSLVATDRAGNDSRPGGPVAVTVRYIELSRKTIRVRAGARFSVRVRTDARFYSWRLGRRAGGRSTSVHLVVRAPNRPGRYALVVEESGRNARSTVLVERRRAG